MRKLEDMTDEQLAMLYVDGDNKAFDLLLSRNESKIFSYIIFIVHDHDTADDIFQETFMKVICRLQQRKYTTSGKFSAWVMRIAHNVIMDWYRLHKVENVVEVLLPLFKLVKDYPQRQTHLNQVVPLQLQAVYI